MGESFQLTGIYDAFRSITLKLDPLWGDMTEEMRSWSSMQTAAATKKSVKMNVKKLDDQRFATKI